MSGGQFASSITGSGYFEMKRAVPIEKACEDCNGTGLGLVKHPAKPGRRIYPGRCNVCEGRGRVAAPIESEPAPVTKKLKRLDPLSFG